MHRRSDDDDEDEDDGGHDHDHGIDRLLSYHNYQLLGCDLVVSLARIAPKGCTNVAACEVYLPMLRKTEEQQSCVRPVVGVEIAQAWQGRTFPGLGNQGSYVHRRTPFGRHHDSLCSYWLGAVNAKGCEGWG